MTRISKPHATRAVQKVQFYPFSRSIAAGRHVVPGRRATRAGRMHADDGPARRPRHEAKPSARAPFQAHEGPHLGESGAPRRARPASSRLPREPLDGAVSATRAGSCHAIRQRGRFLAKPPRRWQKCGIVAENAGKNPGLLPMAKSPVRLTCANATPRKTRSAMTPNSCLARLENGRNTWLLPKR